MCVAFTAAMLVDWVGRRTLFIVSTAGMLVCAFHFALEIAVHRLTSSTGFTSWTTVCIAPLGTYIFSSRFADHRSFQYFPEHGRPRPRPIYHLSEEAENVFQGGSSNDPKRSECEAETAYMAEVPLTWKQGAICHTFKVSPIIWRTLVSTLVQRNPPCLISSTRSHCKERLHQW